MTEQREPHPIRDNIGEWIGKEVEVSNGGDVWLPAILIGYEVLTGNFAVRRNCWEGWKHCRPPQPKRRVPTDQDALLRPRCWVRDSQSDGWIEAMLYGVTPTGEYRFAAKSNDALSYGFYRFCEIEDKS